MKNTSPFILHDQEAFSLKVCPSGVVHLTFGMISLRVEGHTFIHLVEEMSKVSQSLKMAYSSQEQVKKKNLFCSLFPKPTNLFVLHKEGKAN
jgi:hypothetical protein